GPPGDRLVTGGQRESDQGGQEVGPVALLRVVLPLSDKGGEHLHRYGESAGLLGDQRLSQAEVVVGDHAQLRRQIVQHREVALQGRPVVAVRGDERRQAVYVHDLVVVDRPVLQQLECDLELDRRVVPAAQVVVRRRGGRPQGEQPRGRDPF